MIYKTINKMKEKRVQIYKGKSPVTIEVKILVFQTLDVLAAILQSGIQALEAISVSSFRYLFTKWSFSRVVSTLTICQWSTWRSTLSWLTQTRQTIRSTDFFQQTGRPVYLSMLYNTRLGGKSPVTVEVKVLVFQMLGVLAVIIQSGIQALSQPSRYHHFGNY